MSINRNYSAMDNESLIANYILQSGKFGLCTRSDLTKGLRTELKSRIIPHGKEKYPNQNLKNQTNDVSQVFICKKDLR